MRSPRLESSGSLLSSPHCAQAQLLPLPPSPFVPLHFLSVFLGDSDLWVTGQCVPQNSHPHNTAEWMNGVHNEWMTDRWNDKTAEVLIKNLHAHAWNPDLQRA